MLKQNTHIGNFKKYPIWLLPEKSDSAASMCMPLSKPKSGTFIMEIWKDIKGFEGHYQISNFGNIKSFKGINNFNGKLLKPNIWMNYYSFIDLCKNGNVKKYAIHKLVALAFIPNPENKRTINHKNGIKTDNRVENLEWNSYSENMKHAFDNGLISQHKGENNHNSKLNELQVRIIKKSFGELSYNYLAKIFNVKKSTIQSIKRNKSWKYLLNL